METVRPSASLVRALMVEKRLIVANWSSMSV